LIYDQPSTNYDGGNYSDGKSRNDGTLSYANSKFGTGETVSGSVNRRTDTTMTKRKNTKGQTTIYKT
jgi:hypothetical protein